MNWICKYSYILLASASLFFAPLAIGETGMLHFDSEIGDYIGLGESHTYTEADGRFFASSGGNDKQVMLGFESDDSWNLNLRAAENMELTPGYYPGAERCYVSCTVPLLDFWGEGRGCNRVSGEFTVNEAVYDFFGVVRKFSVDFEQHCEEMEPALYGRWDFDFGGIGPTAISAGDVLVANGWFLYVLSPSGELLHRIPMLRGGEVYPNDASYLRGVSAAPGYVHIVVGTSEPLLSSWTPETGKWQQHDFEGWSIGSNATYGKVGVLERYIFTTDHETLNTPRGIVRFDNVTWFGVRFAVGTVYADLDIGLDGYLYALQSDWVTVDKFNPESMQLLDTLILEHVVSSITVDPNGEILATGKSTDGNVYRFDQSGAQLEAVPSGYTYLFDIEIAESGQIVIGTSRTKIILTSDSLSSFNMVELAEWTSSWSYVSFAEKPRGIFSDGFEQ